MSFVVNQEECRPLLCPYGQYRLGEDCRLLSETWDVGAVALVLVITLEQGVPEKDLINSQVNCSAENNVVVGHCLLSFRNKVKRAFWVLQWYHFLVTFSQFAPISMVPSETKLISPKLFVF